MNIAIVFEPNPELGPDPLDHAQMPRRQGEFIAAGSDAFVVWREWGDDFEGGYRDHVVGMGIWENLTTDQIDDALAAIRDEP